MAGRDPVEVTVEADGREFTAGTLWIHDRGGQSATEIERMTAAYETGQRRIARAMAPA